LKRQRKWQNAAGREQLELGAVWLRCINIPERTVGTKREEELKGSKRHGGK